jgi:putative transposon-encoded protein
LSADGRLVLFTSTATTLDRFPPTSESPRGGLYVRDRLLGTTERVLLPVGGEPRFGGSGRAISADGRYVLFGYAYDFGFRNLAVYDRLTGTTELVSVGPDDAPADADSVQPALSADGRYVAFASSASTLAPGESNGFSQIFLRDRLKGTTQIVSRSVLGSVANGPSAAPVISADGRTVAFISRADNLVPGDTNGVPDVFVVELGDRGPTTRVAVFRPETREWIVQQPDGSGKVIPFGGPGDQPVSAAYLGTGTTAQIAVFRPSTGQWFLRADTGATVGPIALGQAGDIPVPADHLGVGHAQIAVFRPRSGEWRVRGDAGEALPPIRFGETGDAPVPADYLGSGKAQIAVFRARPRRLGLWSGTAQWFLRTDTGATLGPIPFGAAGDVAVPADYLGLHRAQIAVFRPSTGEWLIRRDSGETLRILFGTGGDLPVPGDYLGAGHAQIAVYRPSTGEWFVLGEDGAALRIPWGGPGDQPVPGYYALGFVGVP